MDQPTIVMVENHEGISNLLRELLMQAGYHVVICDDGSTAHARIMEAHPQLVILDFWMPGYDGLKVFNHLRADSATAAIPIIFFTAAGAQLPPDVPVVRKPYFQELLRLVEQTVPLR